ncbi:MAG: DoxX family membrane protein [Bacteroidales bacterium]|nr:DoxX family membrane protein [Bacteroidales bacterium]
MKPIQKLLPFFLRVLIGWHFLYEGIIKLAMPDWSAEGYLKGSYGFLSGFFHSLAANEGTIELINFLNIWGLILIGLGLMLGVFIRISAVSGIFLLLLYYFAYPPFGDSLFQSSEGQNWIVNKNIIEAIALAVVLAFPVFEYSITAFFKRKKATQPKTELVAVDSENRRRFLKGIATLPFAGGVIYAAAARAGEAALDGSTGATMTLAEYDLSDLKGTMPKGKIGNLEFSRLVIGCNLISGYAHSRDLHYVGSLFRHYNTEKKIYETYHLAEKAGIDTTNVVLNNFPFMNHYKKVTGSTIKTIAQVHVLPGEHDPLIQFKQARDYGTTSMYVQGGCADQLVNKGQLDYIQKAVEFTKSLGMLAGVGAHSIQVVMECEKAGIRPDYYFKTVHHDNYWSAHPREFRQEFEVDTERSLDHNRFHDNIFDIYPEQTIEVFNSIRVPLFGFKVLAGGAITPEDGFRYAFEAGSDFICVGMFDFQIIENANMVSGILNGDLKRARPWYS